LEFLKFFDNFYKKKKIAECLDFILFLPPAPSKGGKSVDSKVLSPPLEGAGGRKT